MSQWWATLRVMATASPCDGELHELSWASPSRYYLARIQTNLFGELELVRAWGGLRSRRGGHMAEPLASLAQGQLLLHKEITRRQRRGYVMRSVA